MGGGVAKGESETIVVFNPLSWHVRNWVECSLEFAQGQVRGIRSLRSGDEVFGVDILQYSLYADKSIRSATIGFLAKVPPLGFRNFQIMPGEEIEATTITHDTSFSTGNFDVGVDPETGIFQIFQRIWRGGGGIAGEKREGRQQKQQQQWEQQQDLLFAGNELRLEEELGDLYYHKDTIGLMKSESGKGIKYGTFKAESYEVEKGRIRNVIRFKSKYYALRWPYRLTEKFKPMIFRHNFIDVEKEIIIYHDMDRIDFVTRIDDRHPHSRMRVQFDLPVKLRQYWCGTQFGAIQRKADLYHQRDS